MQKVYLIGNAHLDVVWLWRWQEGFAEVKATFQSALDRMDEFPDFKFSCAAACYYQWIEKSEPEMFAQIQQRVREGRWEITGGMFVQPDCNIPCGESFARHGLLSQRYFLEKFGTMAVTGYNVDSFGHNGNLPQILKKCGLENYVFMRPGTHEKELPNDLFQWESQDGSRVLGYRIPYSYTTRSGDTEHISKVYDLAQSDHMDRMAFYGVGNHGGGATIKALNDIHEMDQFKEGDLIFSTTGEYFNSMNREAYPVVRDELQYHGKGCYTSNTKIKKDNRRSEQLALAAEKFASMTSCLLGDKYPAKRLQKAWKNILFNQFHDILAGCVIKEAFDDAAMLHGEAMSIASQAINFACQRISWRIDTLGDHAPVHHKGGKNDTLWMLETVGTPVVLFNPLSWNVRVPVQLRTEITGLKDSQGNPVPFQIVRSPRTSDKDQMDAIFMAEIPALGYSVYHMFLESPTCADDGDTMLAHDLTMENGRVSVTFNPATGAIAQFCDKQTGRVICTNGGVGILMDETDADTWGHDVRERIEYKTSFKKFDIEVGRFNKPEFKLIENGPVRTTMRVITYYGNSRLIQDYSLCAGEEKLRVKVRVEFFEKHKMLKLRFDSGLTAPKAYCEIPYGFKEIPTNGSEEACHTWMAATQDGEGLAIINDCKYGCDAVGSCLDMTVVRGVIYADHWGTRDEFCEYMDQGTHEFHYVVAPYHTIEDCTAEGQELNNAPTMIMETFHKGQFPEKQNGCTVSEKNIIISAIKRAEDNDGFVVRAYECAGRDTKATIHIDWLKLDVKLTFGHNEIKTVKVMDNGEIRETDLLETWDSY